MREPEDLDEAIIQVWQGAFDAAKPSRRVSSRAGNDIVAGYLTRWIAKDPERLTTFLSEHQS